MWEKLETWQKALGVAVGLLGLGFGAHAFHETLATDEEVEEAMMEATASAVAPIEDLQEEVVGIRERHSKLIESLGERARQAQEQAKDNATRLDMLIWMQQYQSTRRRDERESIRERINTARSSLPPSEDPLAGLGDF